MIYVEAALTHHIFHVTVRELVFAIPADAHKDDRRLVVTPLERGLRMLQEGGSGSMMA
jgi:hypothetical protein